MRSRHALYPSHSVERGMEVSGEPRSKQQTVAIRLSDSQKRHCVLNFVQ